MAVGRKAWQLPEQAHNNSLGNGRATCLCEQFALLIINDGPFQDGLFLALNHF